MCGRDPSQDAKTTHRGGLSTNAPAKVRCGHRFCGTCVERNLRRQSQFDCPRCGAPVRRTTLDERTMTDIEVDRDAAARKRVLAVHNRRREHFATQSEYDAYLERVEDLIYDLSRGGPDAKRVEDGLKKFSAEHADEVARNASAKVERERSKNLLIRETAYVAELAAQRARDHDRNWKRKRESHAQHERAFKLGDRADAPTPLDDPSSRLASASFAAPPLPAVLDIRSAPALVTGDDLKRRRRATGFDPAAYAKRRAVADFLTAVHAWDRPDRAKFGMPDLLPYRPSLSFALDDVMSDD